MSSPNRPGMAKNEETVDRQTRENEAIAERVHYTHRLVGMHECAPAPPLPPDTPPTTDEPASQAPATHESAAGQEVIPPQAQAESGSAESSQTAESTETLRCPQCGAANPAAMNQSDDRQSYRCDHCAHLWSAPHADTAEDDMPPVPSIGAQGG